MIHPTAIIDPRAIIGDDPQHRDWHRGLPAYEPEIGPDVRICALSMVDAGMTRPTVIGARTYLLKLVHIGHDSIVGEDCEIVTGTVICGHVEIGHGVRIGAGATVRPFIRIGDGARIGMGAVVVKDVPPGEVWAGNPARKLGAIATERQATPLEEQGWEDLAALAR